MTRPARSPRPHRWTDALAWGLWALSMLAIPVVLWLDRLLRRAGRADLSSLDAGAIVLVALVSAATVGALLGSRRPRHPIGWLLLALALSLAGAGVTWQYALYGLLARPGALPGAGYAAAGNDVVIFPIAASIGLILLLTPTGSAPSPRWRWWALMAVAAAVVGTVTGVPLPFDDTPFQSVRNPLALAALETPLAVVNLLAFALTGLAVPVGAWSLLVRFRRARGLERQQLRWLALAAAVVALAALLAALLLVLGVRTATPIGWLSDVCVVLLPLATGAAILRYRLYDLDRIISRTLAYGALTLLLAGAYGGVVLGLGQLLGRDSSLVVAAATLAVAAAFQPARRRLQQVVDRRFNRRRYDAARTLEAFSARLRQQIDLDSLTTELLAVVEQTMQPSGVSLWLRPSARASPVRRGAGVPRSPS